MVHSSRPVWLRITSSSGSTLIIDHWLPWPQCCTRYRYINTFCVSPRNSYCNVEKYWVTSSRIAYRFSVFGEAETFICSFFLNLFLLFEFGFLFIGFNKITICFIINYLNRYVSVMCVCRNNDICKLNLIIFFL